MKKLVALILSGHTRSFEQCYPSLKQNIIDPLQPDIFISSWSTVGYWTQLTNQELRNNKVNVNELGFEEGEQINEVKIREMYNPKNLTIHSYKDKEAEFIDRVQSLPLRNDRWYYRAKNTLGMYYQALYALKELYLYQYKNKFVYDLVIRTRMDLQFNSPLPFIDNYNKDILCVCNSYAEKDSLGDIFFAGSFDNIFRYHLIYNELEEILKTHPYNPHKLVKIQLERKQIPYQIVDLNVNIINTRNGYCK
jgi:hypothetical protein